MFDRLCKGIFIPNLLVETPFHIPTYAIPECDSNSRSSF